MALYYDEPGGSPQIFRYNNLWENGQNAIHTTIDSTNKYYDPMFVDVDSMDFHCLLYTSPSPRDRTRSRMPSSA